ncbi:A-kinase anchor protein 9 [Rhinophrynus dorsalis]
MPKRRCVELKICQTISCSAPMYRRERSQSSKGGGMDEEDQERKKKLEAGKAKLAQFRQRRGQTDSQNATKKPKKKKTSLGSKQQKHSEDAPEGSSPHSSEAQSQNASGGAPSTSEFTIMRTVPHGETIQHDQTYTIEPESEVSTTADDYSSEEEEFEVRETYSEHGTQSSPTRLVVMEDELAGKQQEIDELNRELEEMRAVYGTEGLQKLQEFETAFKQRDDIITQLTTNLQQARQEKDEIMREFLELTEQSQKLKIQFQHLQASETLRSTSHTSTAADLLHSKQQIFAYQQLLEDQEHQLKQTHKENEEFQSQIVSLQEKIQNMEQLHQNELEKILHEKDLAVECFKSTLQDEERKSSQLSDKIVLADKSIEELREQIMVKNQEVNSLTEELKHSKQKERLSSDEIMQLMGTVEELQKKHHKGSQSEADIVLRMEVETQRRLEELRAELDEMYGQQIVHMKQELVKQHTLQIEKLLAQHKAEVDSISKQTTITIANEQIDALNATIRELNAQLQNSNDQQSKIKENFSVQLKAVTSEKSLLQSQIEDLLQDLSFAKEQIQRAKESITEKESKLIEACALLVRTEELKAELAAANAFTKELESKHEAEVTNYKIKLDMLEREKDAVLDRMAESQEAELEKLRTNFLFSQEEELSKLREDLTREHRINIENLKDNLDVQHKQQIDRIQSEMSQIITAMQDEKDSLITKQNHLMLEISKLKDLLQSVSDPKSEEMMIQIKELQKELDSLRKEEKEKGTIEQDVQGLQLKIELLENEVREKDALNERVTALEMDNRLLKEENNTLQITLKKHINDSGTNMSDDVNSDNVDLKNEIEILSVENKRLRKIELQLKAEIEQQKNTFSFAERNFEVNYQELQEEYACLSKVKEQLEDSKAKQEEEYKLQLSTLNEELAKLKGGSAEEIVVLPDNKIEATCVSRLVRADTLDHGEVVEKDTTELMEKLEVAQRDKEELSLKLSDLSKQLQLKQNEINQLKEHVKSLCQERDVALSDHQKLEEVISVKKVQSVHAEKNRSRETPCVMSSDILDKSDIDGAEERLINEVENESVHPNKCSLSPLLSELYDSEQKEKITLEEEEESLLQRLAVLTSRLENESHLLVNTQEERDQLQDKLATLHQEQADMKLQLEAQRISLTHIHIAHLELIKEEMLKVQEQKIKELQDVHKQELQQIKLQPTGDEERSCQVQTEMERISEHSNQAENVSISNTEQDFTSLRQTVSDSQVSSLNTAVVQEALIAATSQSEQVEKLKTEFRQQRSQLEQKHSQEIEHLRFYFQQQLKENEERYTTEIIHLQEQIQNVGEPSLEFRELSEGPTAGELGSREAEIFRSVCAPVTDMLKMESGDQPVRKPGGTIFQQLQTLRQALYTQYVEEVNALKKQHEAEMVQLRGELEQKYNMEKEALNQEILQLTQSCQEQHNRSFQKHLLEALSNSEDKADPDVNQLLEEHYRQRTEEEVARVIVEMSIEFAQKSELARLAAQENTGTASEHEDSEECIENLDRKESDGHQLHDKENRDLQVDELQTLEEMQLQGGQERSLGAVTEMEVVSTHTSKTSLSSEQNDNELSPRDQDTEPIMKSASKEKTVVLKEEDYNQMVAMGAEHAKLRPLYEQHLEEMRQELVRLEQENQQAIEALRLTHNAQVERQMYDQEQLLSELHVLRSQLAENSSVINENQATDREKMLLEELELMKKTLLESREKESCNLQDNSSQTQNEHVTQAENRDSLWEGFDGDQEGKDENKDAPSSEPTCERNTLIRANKHLVKILLEIVKTTGAVEETIGRHVLGLLDKYGRYPTASQGLVWSPESDIPDADRVVEVPAQVAPFLMEDPVGTKDVTIWPGTTEELDLPLQLIGGEMGGVVINPEEEAQLLNIGTRLQAAVEKLLEAINETSNQLEHARAAQTELVRESIKRKQETADLIRCQEELQERLNEEVKLREHLALELSKAEGLLDGYTDERVFLEKQMQEKTDLIRHLEQKLQSTGNRLQELEQERQQLQEERELLSRQKNALKAEAAPAEQRLVEAAVDAAPKEELLEETEKLLKEKIEVQRQAEKDSGDLHNQVKVLETELEDQVNHYLELEQEKNADLEDLRQKNLSLEKQLEKTRRFLDEQAVDREHERDVFQQEILKLEQQLKMPQRHQPVNDQQSSEVQKLENILKEKTDRCSELVLCKEQLQRDVQERNEELEKLECRIRELEQALLISADSLQKVEVRRQSIVLGIKGEMPLEAQLQVEREAMDRKEKEITNLEEQLEQFREELENKNEEVQQLHMQLEIQRKESATRLQELEQQIKVLKDESLQQEAQEDISVKDLRIKPVKFEEILLLKDQEIDQMTEQIGRLQAQLEAATDNKVIEEKNDQIKEYKIQIKCLKSDQERLKKNSEEEIEKLNEVIEKLQEELANIEQKVSVDFASMTDCAYNSKHQMEDMAAEKELTLAKTELDEAKAEVKLLKEELENLRKSQDNAAYRDSCEGEVKEATQSFVNTALSSERDTMQSTIRNLESKLEELQQVLKEKDSELQNYSDQVKLLKEQTQIIEQLNEVIENLQLELAEKDQMSTMDSTSRTTQDADSSKHHLEATMAEKAFPPKNHSYDTKEALLKSELEEAKAEITLLKEELQKWKNTQENSVVAEEMESKNVVEVDTDTIANNEKIEEALRDKTAALLANQALLASVQDTVQVTIHSLESQVQHLQNLVKEKDSELQQYANQTELLKKRTEEIEQLNGVIESLQRNLGSAKQNLFVDVSSTTENADTSKEKLRPVIPKEQLLLQNSTLNGDELTFVKNELEDTKAELKLLKEELEKLRRTQQNVKTETHESKYIGDVTLDSNKGTSDGVMEEALRQVTAQHTAYQALSAPVQEAMQSTINNMESQLQELQKEIKEKDLQLIQYLSDIELLKEQLSSESTKHDEIMLAMEETLREKVAAALVSEAQMKAIQVHSKQMHKIDDSSIFEEESKGTQTYNSKQLQGEEAESKLSVLSLRLLQLEKQLSDLHEELQVEREHVIMVTQQVAVKEIKLCELQQLLEKTKESRGETTTSQIPAVPSQSNFTGDLEHQLQTIKAEAAVTKEQLCHYREMAEKLKEELMIKETSIVHLEQDLRHSITCLTEAELELQRYKKMEEEKVESKQSTIDVLDGVEIQGQQSALDKKTASSQTDKAHSINNSNQTPHVHLKDIGIQNEQNSTSEEVAQILEQYTEKIGQMQDLHAAEILDMEARHISEADSLRREQYVAVKALTEECDSLKAVIEAMRTPVEGESVLPASFQFPDGTSSDTGTDWSQGTCVVPSDDEVTTDLIPNNIKNLLRAVHQEGIQVLSLTEPDSPEKDSHSFTVHPESWLEERKSLLETIVSLKELIGKMQIHKEAQTEESPDQYERIPDWRGELLRAIQEVFSKEQDVLLTAFHTQLSSLGTCDSAALLNQMQHRLQEQGMEQINAMDCIQNADRRSLLLELRDLRAQLISLHNDGDINRSLYSKAEEMMNHSVAQDQPHQMQEMHLQLSSVTVRAQELQEQLGAERQLVAEIKSELAQTREELESSRQIQHKHFTELESLRTEVKQRSDELDGVNEALANEQKKTRELQWALEKEKTKTERKEERGREELEDLKMLVEEQRLKNMEINQLLENEKKMVKDLQERIASREMAYDSELCQEKSKVSELQAFLQEEKARSNELVNALGCKKELDSQVQNRHGHNPAEDMLKELQSQLEAKHNRIVELVSEMEGYKLECAQLRQNIEEERQSHERQIQAQEEVGKTAQAQAQELRAHVEDLQHKLKQRTLEVQKLQTDEKRMKETIKELEIHVQKNAAEYRTDREELGESSGGNLNSAALSESYVQRQKAESVPRGLSPAPVSAVNGDRDADEDPFSVENIRLRLQEVSDKLKQLATKASQRILFVGADDEDFAWSQNSIQEVISQLEQVAVWSLQGKNLVLPPGISTNSLTEKLLTQNAELTGYVSRLTEEKNGLRNALLKMEEEACLHRLRGPSGDCSYRSSLDNAANIDMLIASEREVWSREKLNLQKSLKQTEAELSKVKAELRNEAMQRDLGRESENVTLKRIYGKYLRSESFRKALVYQKKYLLLLLGGFQECEEATLALIARMGGQPSYTDLEVITNHSRAFTRFRSAVRVSIAISRMRFLVRRWQRATGSSQGSMNRNGFGQTSGNEMRTDSPYLPTGSLELFGEQRHSACRSRSGFDSPQSTVNSQHRYNAVSTELSPCSHLRHYDPDRALTDYITRLESLQKRLGIVQSGSSANNTTHYGTRR